MLRKIAAGTSAAVVAACLAAAPVAAIPADPCADMAHTCLTVVPAVADFSSVRRGSPSPPPVGTPVPEEPSNPPSDDSGPGGPGPGDATASPTAPPLETAGPPAVPEFTPVPAPPPMLAPTPTSAPPEPQRPPEAVLPTAETPRLPQTAADSRPLMVAGGGSLVAAGLAWIGGARRRRKQPVSGA